MATFSSSTAYDSIVPTMVSSNSPSPFVISASSESYPVTAGWRAFSGTSYSWVGAFSVGVWLKVDCGAGNEKCVNSYSLYEFDLIYAKGWIFQGSNDDSLWDDLDTRTGQDITTRKFYHFQNSDTYRYYRFYFTDRYGNGGSISVRSAELYHYEEESSSVSSVSSASSSSCSSSSNSSSQSSLYGYLDAPTNIRKTSLDFSTGKVKIEWDWENNPLATPQEPSGFILQKRIGSRDWETIEFYIPGDAREYEDTLSRDELRLMVVGGESLAYKIRAYWHFVG